MNPSGGLARRAWLIDRIETNYPGTPLVLLDTGNFSDNPTQAGDLRTHTLLETMAQLGYKVVGIGERDLMLGYDDFERRSAGIGMDFISTNVVKQGTTEPVFTPYAVVDAKAKDGKPIRIGVLAVNRFNPVWQKAGPGGTNMAVAPPETMLATYLPELRAKADVLVLLASLAKDDVHALARRFPDIDLVLASYGGIYNATEENEGPVRIYYSGNQGKRIGESRIVLDAHRRPETVTTYLHFLVAAYPEEKTIQKLVAEVTAKAAAPDAEPASAKKAAPAVAPGGAR